MPQITASAIAPQTVAELTRASTELATHLEGIANSIASHALPPSFENIRSGLRNVALDVVERLTLVPFWQRERTVIVPRQAMDTFIYDGTHENLEKDLDLHSKGVKILCYKCHAELIVAPDLESANKHKTHPGVFCPVSHNHISVLFSLKSVRDPVWERLKRKSLEREKLAQAKPNTR